MIIPVPPVRSPITLLHRASGRLHQPLVDTTSNVCRRPRTSVHTTSDTNTHPEKRQDSVL